VASAQISKPTRTRQSAESTATIRFAPRLIYGTIWTGHREFNRCCAKAGVVGIVAGIDLKVGKLVAKGHDLGCSRGVAGVNPVRLAIEHLNRAYDDGRTEAVPLHASLDPWSSSPSGRIGSCAGSPSRA
jgi:hypothetical protein